MHFTAGKVMGGLALFAAALTAQTRPNSPPRPMPEGPGRDVTQKVCGTTCHSAEMFMNRGRSREQWAAVTNEMVSRGAKAPPAELTQIVDYLSAHVGPGYTAQPVAEARRPGAGPVTGRGPGPLGAGAA